MDKNKVATEISQLYGLPVVEDNPVFRVVSTLSNEDLPHWRSAHLLLYSPGKDNELPFQEVNRLMQDQLGLDETNDIGVWSRSSLIVFRHLTKLAGDANTTKRLNSSPEARRQRILSNPDKLLVTSSEGLYWSENERGKAQKSKGIVSYYCKLNPVQERTYANLDIVLKTFTFEGVEYKVPSKSTGLYMDFMQLELVESLPEGLEEFSLK